MFCLKYSSLKCLPNYNFKCSLTFDFPLQKLTVIIFFMCRPFVCIKHFDKSEGSTSRYTLDKGTLEKKEEKWLEKKKIEHLKSSKFQSRMGTQPVFADETFRKSLPLAVSIEKSTCS